MEMFFSPLSMREIEEGEKERERVEEGEKLAMERFFSPLCMQERR